MYFLSGNGHTGLGLASFPISLGAPSSWFGPDGKTNVWVCAQGPKNRFISARALWRSYSLFRIRLETIRGDYVWPANWSASWVRELNWRLNNFPFLTGDIHQLSKLECNALEIICAVCNVIIRYCFIISLRPTILKRYLDYWVSLALWWFL